MITARKVTWDAYQQKEIVIWELKEPGGLCVKLSNYGALVQSLLVKDGTGMIRDVVLGYDHFHDYLANPHYFGAAIGPLADRIHNAVCIIEGQTYCLEKNAGSDCLHSGSCGFHNLVWEYDLFEGGMQFTKKLNDGEGGLPGNRTIFLQYRVYDTTLEIHYEISTDRITLCNPTHHSYFNLTGCLESVRGHELQLSANTYWQPDLGITSPVSGFLDFTEPCTLDTQLQKQCHGKCEATGIDHFFPVSGSGIRPMGVLSSQISGLQMTCWSDAPGILVYTGNYIDSVVGKGGRKYRKHEAICLEPQSAPNAHKGIRDRNGILLKPNETFHRTIRYVFDTRNELKKEK